MFWLPLLAQHPSVDLAAPLDVAWVWHVHMLSPLSYERDCKEIVSVLVDHKNSRRKNSRKGIEKIQGIVESRVPQRTI